MRLSAVLVGLGGLLAVIAGLYSALAGEPLVAALTGGAVLGGLGGATLTLMGVVGVVGGVAAIASAQAGLWLGALIGGILGLAAPCALSILAVVGGILMKLGR